MCDPKAPYQSAVAAMSLELWGFFEAQAAAGAKQVADWHAGIRRPSRQPGSGGRVPTNPFHRAPRRSLQASCSGTKEFMKVRGCTMCGEGLPLGCSQQ